MHRLSSPSPFLLKANKSRKYSNNTIFNRREAEYSSRMKPKNISNMSSSIQRPYSTIRNVTLRNLTHKKPQSKLIKTFYPKLPTSTKSSTYSTNESKSTTKNKIHVVDYFHSSNHSKNNPSYIIESIINLEKYYTPNITIYRHKKAKNGNNKYLNDIKYINQIYLTEVNVKKPEIKKNEDDIVNFNNFDDYCDEHIFIDYSKNQNADILLQFKKEKLNYNYEETIKTEHNDRIINNKRNRINIIKERVNDFMSKTRKEKTDKFALNAKKELYIRMKEIYQNKLEYLDDRINSFENWKKLNHDFFDQKIGDYLKFLMYKKEFEKNKCEEYVQEILQLKKELNKLASKMSKIELERYNILRWVFFQIKLKERRTELPLYYKDILENLNIIEKYYQNKLRKEKSSEIIQNMNSTSNKNISSNSPKKRERHKKYHKSIIEQNSDKEKEKEKDKDKDKEKTKDKDKENDNLKLNNELIAFLNKEEGKKEYLRIKEYINQLIYKTAEDFNDRLLSIEQEDLRLIEKNDYTQEKLYQFRQEFEMHMKEKFQSYINYKSILRKKKNELNILKNRNTAMEEIIKLLKESHKNKKENKNKKVSTRITKREDIIIKRRNNSECVIIKKPIINYKKLLIIKIGKLFEICKQVKMKDENIYEILEEKRKLLKDNEILFYFVYIEFCVNYLLGYVETYKKTHKEGNKTIKNIQVDIERGHRIEKAIELRKQLIDKDIILEYEINQRNNKIYFLPYRKIFDIPRSKKEKIVITEKENRPPIFEDFIFADDDSYHNLEEKKNVKEK